MAFKDNVGVQEELKVELIDCLPEAEREAVREKFIQWLLQADDATFARVFELGFRVMNESKQNG